MKYRGQSFGSLQPQSEWKTQELLSIVPWESAQEQHDSGRNFCHYAGSSLQDDPYLQGASSYYRWQSHLAYPFFISSKTEAEALVQQHVVCCCVPNPAFTHCRAGAPRANGAGDFWSAQTELYAVKQFVSETFHQADGSREVFSALRGSLQLIVCAARAWWTATAVGNENGGNPNKWLILHQKTLMDSKCFIYWKLWKFEGFCNGNRFRLCPY